MIVLTTDTEAKAKALSDEIFARMLAAAPYSDAEGIIGTKNGIPAPESQRTTKWADATEHNGKWGVPKSKINLDGLVFSEVTIKEPVSVDIVA